jgi:hypothetical protein
MDPVGRSRRAGRQGAASGSPSSLLEDQLVILETHGLNEFVDGDHYVLLARFGKGDPVVEASKTLITSGIRDGYPRPPVAGEARGLELRTSWGGPVDPESVARAVEDRASERGNVKKLRAATHATARHIFVPIYFGAPMEFTAVMHMPLSHVPTLPPEVTRAWVLGPNGALLYVEPAKDWQRARFDSLALSTPEAWEAAP